LKIIVKPQAGQKGRDVQIINKPTSLSELELPTGDWLVQPKLEVKKINGHYWDIRAFVINGKFSDAIIRHSTDPIVSVSRGGDTARLDENIKSQVAQASEEIIRQINQFL
jgi:glutathionylspermidine synthase